MKDIMNAPFLREMMMTTANMYRLGYDERNGGNISYMLDPEVVGEYLERACGQNLHSYRNRQIFQKC